MKARHFLYTVVAFFITNLNAQQTMWTRAGSTAYNSYTASAKTNLPGKWVLSKIDLSQLGNTLRAAPLERSTGGFTRGIHFFMPLPDETIFHTAVMESPIWEHRYAQQFSQIKTYNLSDPITQSCRGRITLTPEGISGILFTDRGMFTYSR